MFISLAEMKGATASSCEVNQHGRSICKYDKKAVCISPYGVKHLVSTENGWGDDIEKVKR